jgi:hypothetical protein
LKEERGHRWFLLDLAQTQWGWLLQKGQFK